MNKSKLVGDIRCNTPETSKEIIESFLVELELLMLRYKIEKVDIAWKKFDLN